LLIFPYSYARRSLQRMIRNAPLVARLRTLLSIAEQAGCDRVWLHDTADALVEVVLAQRIDPRRRRSLAKATTLAIALRSMQRAGFTHGGAVGALGTRHGLSRSRVYELLKLSGNNAGRIRR
jgi:hypothetical protein